jgi:cysteine desulfurase/selenocysteine lyase
MLAKSRNSGAVIDPAKQASVRELFPGATQQIYLDTAGRNLIGTPVRAAIDGYLDMRALGGDKKKMFESVERVRRGFASMIGASPDEVAITKNISDGINMVAHAVDWRRNDNVVICADVEHPNNIYPWLHAAKLYGTTVRNVQSRGGHIDPDIIRTAVDAHTRVVTLSSTSFLPGFRIDLAAIADVCKSVGAEFMIDGAQSMGVHDIDVTRHGIGAIAASTQKGLLGLYGMGFLYCRKNWADRMTPRYLARFGVDLGDRHEADLDDAEEIVFRPGALRFDLGNYNFIAAAALEPALDILQSLGIEPIDRYTQQLAVKLGNGLQALGLPVIGWPAGPHIGSIVTIGSLRPDDAVTARLANLRQYLESQRVKLSERRGCLRFSLHVYNNSEDVDQLLELVRRWNQ